VLSGITLPISAIIISQDSIIGEKQSGTAAWVLSKPVTRAAFILSRLGADALGLLVTGVLIQGVIAYTQISIAIKVIWPRLRFLEALGLVFLYLIFYLTLMRMLGTLFKSWGLVVGISLPLAIGGNYLVQLVPFLKLTTPWTFFMPAVCGEMSLAFSLATGRPLFSVIPIISCILLSICFTAISVWRFQREEF